MRRPVDFLTCIPDELCLHIMSFIDDGGDLVRASAVSRLWRKFIITNGFAKQLCSRMFPQMPYVAGAGNGSDKLFSMSSTMDWELLVRQHNFCASLHSLAISNCPVAKKIHISAVLRASSTKNTHCSAIFSRQLGFTSDLYWSSKGQNGPDWSETLTYKLINEVCVISEIRIQPFREYCSKSVRFRFGMLKGSQSGFEFVGIGHLKKKYDDDMFIWTYTSPEYPMKECDGLQSFVLPEPFIMIDGCVQIELLGGVRRDVIDDLFYVRVQDVQVLGLFLWPVFYGRRIDGGLYICIKRWAGQRRCLGCYLYRHHYDPGLLNQDPFTSGVKCYPRRERWLHMSVLGPASRPA